MDYLEERSSIFLSHKREFADYLERSDADYRNKIEQMKLQDKNRLMINLNDLRSYNAALARSFILNPAHYVAPFTAAMKELIRILPTTQADFNRKHEVMYSIGVEGNFGSNRMTPRQLQAHHLGQLVCIEGIATKCSVVRPKVVRTVHHSDKTHKYQERVYHDATSLTGFPTSSIYPTIDAEGNPLVTEFGLSLYQDHQTLSIQEMPEKAPAGLLPSSIDVVLDDDLVDKCKPGDRVQIIGIYRALPSKSGAENSGVFKSVLIANNVRPMMKGGQIGDLTLTETDISQIREVSRNRDLFQLFSRSIAPSIYGHSHIKSAIILLLLGGVEKNLDNGTHIRGDINLLMVGDPSTAKSQILRYVLNIAPLAINTTGRGSTGVGLTAAVTTDKETGDRRLEAGAMVLADRGVVCIDEFDKMSDIDRVAIHEVMEQQTVTIAKAGIHMSLNARCSVVAAANPRYSQYDKTKSPAFNVNLPDSLLSRFDLLFIVLDEPDAAVDRAISDRVLNNHRYFAKKGTEEGGDGGVGDGEAMDADTALDSTENGTSIYQKSSSLLHTSSSTRAAQQRDKVLTMSFLKKYFQFAKATISPILTEESAKLIGNEYAALRTEQANKMNGYPITARCLETLIRLSTAHAKLRLNEEVEEEDVHAALAILKYAIDGSKDEKAERLAERRRQREARASGGNQSSDSEGDDEEDTKGGQRANRRRSSIREQVEMKRKQDAEDEDGKTGYADDSDEGEHKYDEEDGSTRRRTRSSVQSMGDDDLDDASPTKRSRASSSRIDSQSSSSLDDPSGSMDVDPVSVDPDADDDSSALPPLPASRLADFTRRLAAHMKWTYTSPLDSAFNAINTGVSEEQKFSRAEMTQALEILTEQQKILIADGNIHKL